MEHFSHWLILFNDEIYIELVGYRSSAEKRAKERQALKAGLHYRIVEWK